jgi:hypothetical protein
VSDDGAPLAPGIYLLRFTTRSAEANAKLVVSR